MLDSMDGELKKLFNTSGKVFKELNLKDKLPSMSKTEAFKLLASDGKLIKRPFLVSKEKGIVGFKEENWEEFIQ